MAVALGVNGGILGPANTPSTSSASGLWTWAEQYRAQRGGTWPLAGDQYFDYVTLLLHGNGTNGAQNNTFLDSSTNNFTITRNGNTTQGTFTPYGANWSNYFDGTGDFLSLSANSAFDITSGDFTLETWVFRTTSGAEHYLFSNRIDTPANSGWECRINATNTIQFFFSGGSSITSTGTIPANTWTHVAVSRQTNTVRIFINGALDNSATFSNGTSASGTGLYIGYSTSGGGYMTGYMSNARLVKGTAVYTSAFTPSTTPLTAVSGTSLLTCQANRFRDASTNNFTITRNGDVSVQRFSPFNPTTPYAAGTIGGSGYFDGSGDYLSAPDNAAWYFTGDFTVECWAYWSSVSSSEANVLAQHRPASAANQAIEFWSNATTLYLAYSSSNVTTTITANQWYHLAMSCSSGTASCYVNGTRIGTFVMPTRIDSADPFTVGARTGSGGTGGTGYFTGYVSDVRVVNGTGLYSGATITVPTAPLTAITNTSLLCSFTNGGIIDNAMMNDLETVGNAQISTSVSKFGGGSLAFDGSGDYLLIPNGENFNFGSGSWTIEFWVRFNTVGVRQVILSSGNGSGTNAPFFFELNNSLRLRFLIQTVAAGQIFVDTTYTPNANEWYHLAGVRNGSTATFYVNGVSVGSVTPGTSALTAITNQIVIGDYIGLGIPLNGYLDDVRFTKGYARYVSNFSVPTAPFPDQ